MKTLSIKIHREEFFALVRYCNERFGPELPADVRIISLAHVLLHEWTKSRLRSLVDIWLYYPAKKEYKTRLPLAVAKALYDEMQTDVLPDFLKLVLGKLDKAFIDCPTLQTVL